ncbi:MAG: hypothetical protein J0653_02980, partial [Deltaproteobacteria bacterium]|nr:hypothetical protein [Deltaproteobacteria bacterium]
GAQFCLHQLKRDLFLLPTDRALVVAELHLARINVSWREIFECYFKVAYLVPKLSPFCPFYKVSNQEGDGN